MTPAAETPLELEFMVGGHGQHSRLTSGKKVIGRNRADCDIVVEDVSVSRRHASLELVGERWVLTDLGSANGTLVNGRPTQRQELNDGDVFQLGKIAIACRIEGAANDGLTENLEEPTRGMAIQTCDIDELLDDVYEGSSTSSSSDSPTNLSGSRESRVMTPRPPAGGAERTAWILRILRDASDALLANDELRPTLKAVMDLVFQHLPADRGQILLRQEGTDRLKTAVRRYRPEAEREGLAISRHIAVETVKTRRAMLVKDTQEDARYNELQSIVSMNIRSAMCAPLCHKDNVLGLIWLDRTSADSTFDKTHLEVLSILASLSAAAVERAQLRESVERERRVRERLSRYHAPAVVDQIVNVTGSEMEASERDITVLFCDIVKFTTLSEKLSPGRVTNLLNEIFQALTEEVFREAGTLDKFIGDAMMVFFGAPIRQDDHAARAVRTALAMQRRMAELNASGTWDIELAIRIGINSGPAIVGDVGAEQRRDYTVIGDTVNVASRLESSVAGLGQVVIGENTYRQVGNEFSCVRLGAQNLRNKEAAIQAYLVRG